MLTSEVVDIEVSKIPDDDRRQKVSILTSLSRSNIVVDEDIEKRALELEQLGFKSLDALPIACAEKGGADVLLTTDDDLLRKASQSKGAVQVRLENPVSWVMEVIGK